MIEGTRVHCDQLADLGTKVIEIRTRVKLSEWEENGHSKTR